MKRKLSKVLIYPGYSFYPNKTYPNKDLVWTLSLKFKE